MLKEKKKILKRIRVEWRNLTSEYLSLRDVELKALQLFNEEISFRAKKENVDLEFKPEKKEKQDKTSVNEEEIKSIFREIAKKGHPDKIEKYDQDIFIESAKAKKEGEISKLIDNAIKLNVNVDGISFRQIEQMEREVDSLKLDIKNIIESIHWKWYHETNKNKGALINNILNNIKHGNKKNKN